ncbi:MAG TPA: TatD family hydrolase [Candidatus Caccenecus avistercoris]|nr:TatD family hydrolase [Candidatus Caccenecus avistercoris]
MFTDTHCHIYKEYYENIDEILKRALESNINRVINNGCNRESNKEVLALANTYNNMYIALGIHPESADTYQKEDLTFIEENLSNPKVIAIGEIGLDYHYTKENKTLQIKLLESQLKIAETHNLPVIIHSREATEDTINTLKKYHIKGVIHSFSGSLETAKIYIKMGYLLGINGVITFKNSKLKEVIKELPLEHLVLETDSPYLTPEPFRGKPNEPARIKEIATFISELKGISLEELARITNENIMRIFDI